MVYLCTALNLLQNGGTTLTVELWFDVFGLCTRRACWFEVKFMDNNFWCECAIHLLHDVHSQVNWRCLWTTFFCRLACSLSTTNQTNRPYLLPNCVSHFSEAACRFAQHVYGEDECFENLKKSFECGNGWWIQHSEFTQLDDECFAPLPFSPDGTAERRRHSTVQVHETTCFACFPVWKRIQGFRSDSRRFWVSFKFFIRSTRWRPTHLSKTCVRDLVVVIRFLRIFAW